MPENRSRRPRGNDVNAAEFVRRRSPQWDRLEELLARAGRRGAAAWSEDELEEMLSAYPGLAVDVSRARLHGLDASLQERLNRLAFAAHGLVYQRPRSAPLTRLRQCLVAGYPRLFRRLGGYVALAAALFAVGAVGAFTATRLHPPAAYAFVPQGLEMPDSGAAVTSRDISERFRQIARAPMAAGIIANNLSVAFNAFALGISAGILTCYVIFVNAMMLGAFAGHFANHDLVYPLAAFLTPHGVLEIFAILVAAAAGLRMGLSLALPGRRTRGASLRAGARDAVLLVLGTVPMFLVAGLVEGFVTPAYIPGWVKIVLGCGLGAGALVYLLTAGRNGQATAG